MKFAVPLALVTGALAGTCDFTTCSDCMANALCGWYKTSVDGNEVDGDLFAGCKVLADVAANDLLSATVTLQTVCPDCQAGACDKCIVQSTAAGACQWLKGPIGIGSYCETFDGVIPLAFEVTTTCPNCPSDATCSNCETTSGCRWYADIFGAGTCADAEPFGKALVVSAACAGNPCTSGTDCSSCVAIADSAGDNPCTWLEPKDFYAPFKQSKCDLLDPGDIDDLLYDSITGTCPVCSGNTCSSCQAETGCRYTAAVVLGAYGFGACITDAAAIPGGKEVIDVCRDSCDFTSCSACDADPDCSWYDAAGIYNAGCDVTNNPKVLDHIGQDPVTTCPPCAFSDCVACRGDTTDDCGWYVNTYPWGDAIEESGDCEEKPYTPVILEVEVDDTNEDDLGCFSSSGFLLAPGAAILVALF